MRALVWFRSDLRTDDNPALRNAVRMMKEGVAGLFLVCRRQWEQHDWGAPKIGFLRRSVEDIRHNLEALGIPLLVRDVGDFAAAPDAVAEIAAALSADGVFANREYEVNERKRDQRVEARLREEGREIRWFDEQTVVPPQRLRTGKGGFYSVFTPFWRAWVRELEDNELPLARDAPGRVTGNLSIADELAEETSFVSGESDGGVGGPFEAGELAARRRLDAFVGGDIEGYGLNRDLAAEEGTSGLSPYLAVGSLSVRRCLETALAANAGRFVGGRQGVDTWIKELAWREFYRHVVVGFPRVSKSRPFRVETEGLAWRDDAADFDAWCAGRTGVPFVDAGMRQMLATGWMHNRLRMVTAMFLTKNLLIDWRAGERFFNRHLVDADLANNNGGWQWSASTGTDAAPYFRIFNPWLQAKRYDPEGRFIRRWVPELTEVPSVALHDPDRLRAHVDGDGYPLPIVDLAASRARALTAFGSLRR